MKQRTAFGFLAACAMAAVVLIGMARWTTASPPDPAPPPPPPVHLNVVVAGGAVEALGNDYITLVGQYDTNYVGDVFYTVKIHPSDTSNWTTVGSGSKSGPTNGWKDLFMHQQSTPAICPKDTANPRSYIVWVHAYTCFLEDDAQDTFFVLP